MSVANRILKQDKTRLLYGVFRQQNRAALQSFPSKVARRFLATPVKGSTQPPASDSKAPVPEQTPHAAAKPQVAPSQGTAQKTTQRVSQPVPKASTPAPKAPAPAASSAAPQKAATSVASSPAASSTAPQKAASSAPLNQPPKPAASGVQKAAAPSSPAGPPPSGTTTVKPQEFDKRKLLLASGATAGLASAIFYWQYNPRKSGQDPAEVTEKVVIDPRLADDSQTEKPVRNDTVEATEAAKVLDDQSEVASEVADGPGENALLDKQSAVDDVAEGPEVSRDNLSTEPEEDKTSTETTAENIQGSPEKSEPEQPKLTGSDEATIEVMPDSDQILRAVLFVQKIYEAIAEKIDSQEVYDAAVNAAEQRQAVIDAALYKEQLQKAEENHQHALRSVQLESATLAAQLHRAEKDMLKASVQHEEDRKILQQKADDRLQTTLMAQEEATQRRIEDAEFAAKASALTTLAEERVVFLKDIGSLKLHMEAMNAALDAKSEEAREGHTVNKLSLGTFALEDALQTGAPIKDDVSFILQTAGGDPLVEVAVRALPELVLESGTLTRSQLDRLLEDSMDTLKQLALIPAEGGGLLSHLLAGVASTLKVSRNVAPDGGGVESTICAVENLVKSGNLKDAADVLEKGLSGTSAQNLAAEWARHARNRAVLEQVCSLLRAHAAAIALKHAS